MGFLVPRARKVIIFGGARCGFYVVNNGSERMSAHFGPEWSPDRLGEVLVLHFGSISEPFGAHFGTMGPFFSICFPIVFVDGFLGPAGGAQGGPTTEVDLCWRHEFFDILL